MILYGRPEADRNTRDYSAWTVGNGDPMHELCIPHSIPRAWKKVSVKQEEEPDTRIMRENSKKSGRKERGDEGEKSQTRTNKR